jgi:hypothetical protein
MKNKFFKIFIISLFFFLNLHSVSAEQTRLIHPNDVKSHNQAIRIIIESSTELSQSTSAADAQNRTAYKNTVAAYIYIFKDILIAQKLNDFTQLYEIFKLLENNNLPIQVNIFDKQQSLQIISAQNLAERIHSKDDLTRLLDTIKSSLRISIPISVVTGFVSMYVMLQSDNSFFTITTLASGMVFVTAFMAEVTNLMFGDALIWEYHYLNNNPAALNGIHQQAQKIAIVAANARIGAPAVAAPAKTKCFRWFRNG